MRTRAEVEEDKEWSFYKNGELENSGGTPVKDLMLEVLLDIRDLLTQQRGSIGAEYPAPDPRHIETVLKDLPDQQKNHD